MQGFRLLVGSMFIVSSLLLVSCDKKVNEGALFASIGKTGVSQERFNQFTKMREYYPAFLEDKYFPASRSDATLCVETEVLFGQPELKPIKDSVRKSLDWQWKERFFPTHVYMTEIIEQNLGFSDAEVEEYYNKNKESFKKIIKIEMKKTADTTAASGSKDSSVVSVSRDSVVYPALAGVKDEIVTKMFLAQNPPDENFFISMRDTSAKETDSARINRLWMNQVQRDKPSFFMKKLYRTKFGTNYPDSLRDVYGSDKVIKPEDVEMILNWLSAGSREAYSTFEKQRFLVEWLLKWKLFSEEARRMGYFKRPDVVLLLDWAFKYTVVYDYINTIKIQKLKSGVTLDTMLCYYEYWDRSGTPGVAPDSASLREIIASNIESKAQIALDEYIYSLRQRQGVVFHMADYADGKVKDPKQLAAVADSLYAAGDAKEAEKIYRSLVDDFPYSSQGQNAFVELAKILTENESYSEAVRNYRRYLLYSSDESRRCNIFFMIGFVYGEYLSRPDVAEAHYKWILKNTPQCELTDDAEFMYLHLDEPMIGVEELQGEAKRQGKADDAEQPSTSR